MWFINDATLWKIDGCNYRGNRIKLNWIFHWKQNFSLEKNITLNRVKITKNFHHFHANKTSWHFCTSKTFLVSLTLSSDISLLCLFSWRLSSARSKSEKINANKAQKKLIKLLLCTDGKTFRSIPCHSTANKTAFSLSVRRDFAKIFSFSSLHKLKVEHCAKRWPILAFSLICCDDKMTKVWWYS